MPNNNGVRFWFFIDIQAMQTVLPLTYQNKTTQIISDMKTIFTTAALFIFTILCCNNAQADTNFYLEMQRISGNSSTYEVKIKMCMAGNTLPNRLGNASLSFSFNDAVLGNPTLVSSPLNNTGKYFCNLVSSSNKKASFNIIQDFSTYLNGEMIATSANFQNCTELAVIRFDVYNPNGNVNLQWVYDGSTNETNVAVDDATFGVVPQTQILTGSAPPSQDYLRSLGSTTPLPVTLVGLDAVKKDNGTATVSWQTTTEINSAWFEVQHSTNREKWKNIDEIVAAGYSNNLLSYDVTHQTPEVGSNFYRLKMIDADGSFEYSKEINLDIKAEKPKLQVIYPMPVQSNLNLRYTTAAFEKAQIAIYDAQARLVIARDVSNIANANEVQINVESLSSGTYLVKLQLDNTLMHGRFIKE